jgi:2-polyprenyl-3-methyl-5-hydroxy-6-metoxy-1,4-benzoquinol methylase
MIKGNVETLDELKIEERFEGIWSNNLFEHLLSPHAFLIRLKTMVRPDTRLVLGVPVLPRIRV